MAAVATDKVDVVVIGCSRAGKGAAVRRGLLTSTSPLVGFYDADLATPLETLAPTVEALRSGADAVIASRHVRGASFVVPQPLRRRVGGDAFRLLTRKLVPGVADTQCGFKFFRRESVQTAIARVRTTGFAFDVELLAHVQRAGGKIVELPVAWTDAAGSTFHPIRDGLASFPRRLPPPWERPVIRIESPFAPLAQLEGARIVVLNWRDVQHPQAGGAEQYMHQIATRWVEAGARVTWLTARGPGQSARAVIDGIEVARAGGALSLYPRTALALLRRFGRIDYVVDCQNGIPFFSPLFVERDVPVVQVVHHVHQDQFGMRFGPVLAAVGRFLEGHGDPSRLQGPFDRCSVPVHPPGAAPAAGLPRPDPHRAERQLCDP